MWRRLSPLLALLAGVLACGPAGPATAPDVGRPVADVETDAAEVRAPEPFDWCSPDQPPDAACFAARRDPESENIAVALAIAGKQVEEHPPETLAWNWEEAVLMAGFVELYRVTEDEWLIDYVEAWVDHHIDKGYKIGTSDNCAPTAAAVWLYEYTQQPRFRTVVEDGLHYLYEEAKRTVEGGISHLGTVDIVTLWVDSLFMFGDLLISWGETTGDADALDTFGTQFGIFTDLLQAESGFYVHAYAWIVEQTPGTYWARGNGWVVAAAWRYLRVRQIRGEEDPVVAEAARTLLDAAREAQDPETGLWWTLLDKPGEVYLETSASALFAYGMARAWRLGRLEDDWLEPLALAMEGIRSRIVEDDQGRPVVTGISGPTSADKAREYAKVALEDDLPYGVGAVLLALVESSGLPLEQQ
jgi:unsaturated rhamnogalacturonyl hydrolase